MEMASGSPSTSPPHWTPCRLSPRLCVTAFLNTAWYRDLPRTGKGGEEEAAAMNIFELSLHSVRQNRERCYTAGDIMGAFVMG